LVHADYLHGDWRPHGQSRPGSTQQKHGHGVTLRGPLHPVCDGVIPPPLGDLYEAYRQGLHASDEVHRHTTNDEIPCVVAHERTPALRRHAVAWSSIEVLGQVLADRARRDSQARLELQFVRNTPLTPGEIVTRHLPDKPLQLHWDWGPARTCCVAPEQVPPLAPPLKRFRLYHDQS
jgi:hypothetical protein